MPKSSEDRAKTRYGSDDDDDDAMDTSIKKTGPQSPSSLKEALKYIVSGPSPTIKRQQKKPAQPAPAAQPDNGNGGKEDVLDKLVRQKLTPAEMDKGD
jgi:hypothetical protein